MSSHPSLSARAGLVQVSLAGVLWGTGGLAVQVLRDVVPMSVLVISAWRMVIAALVLVAALAVTRQGAGVVALLRTRPGAAVLVGTGTGLYQALYFGSVVTAGVTVATVVSLGLAPVLLTLGEAVHDRRRPDRIHLLVLGAALAGLLLVSGTTHAGAGGSRPALGVLLAAASGAVYAATTALGRPLAQIASPLALTTTTTTAGALALLPLAGVAAWSGSPVLTTDPAAVGTLLYLGVLTMALAYGLLYAGLRTTTGSAAVIATLLEPVTAAVVAAAFLGERMGPAGIVGTGLILVAVAGLGRRPVVPPG
jgi:DME family drug/metabolite transporter